VNLACSAFTKQYVYDPHLKPMFEDMLATLRHHSQCLSDPIFAIVDPDERQVGDRDGRLDPGTPTPWRRYHPARHMDVEGPSDNELQREMEYLGIPDVHEDQFASPGSVSMEFKGFDPIEEYCENEARRGGRLGSALGIDLLACDAETEKVSGTTTAINPIFGVEHDSGICYNGWIPDEGHLRRRRPERDLTDPEKSFLAYNSSQATIVPVRSAADVPLPPDDESMPGSPSVERVDEEIQPDQGGTALSSPNLTRSSIMDVASIAPSAFSVSSASDRGDYDMPSSAFPSEFSTRMHSPAFSSSSYDVLSPPAGVASMSNSLHDMDASVSLETYPPFDEYNVHYARHNISRAVSHASSRASDSGWTDGELASDDDW
jgi:hypothetical protein